MSPQSEEKCGHLKHIRKDIALSFRYVNRRVHLPCLDVRVTSLDKGLDSYWWCQQRPAVCVCVCVRERERERDSATVEEEGNGEETFIQFWLFISTLCVCVCVCVCVWWGRGVQYKDSRSHGIKYSGFFMGVAVVVFTECCQYRAVYTRYSRWGGRTLCMEPPIKDGPSFQTTFLETISLQQFPYKWTPQVHHSLNTSLLETFPSTPHMSSLL